MPSAFTIVSGGQTGADRGGLEAAIELKIEHGGWCPKGRKAADGRIPFRYHMAETTTSAYPQRTRLNIKDSDGTIIFSWNQFSRGTELTVELCEELGKPYRLITTRSLDEAKVEAARFIVLLPRGGTLNVAGNREEKAPGIFAFVKTVLVDVLRDRAL